MDGIKDTPELKLANQLGACIGVEFLLMETDIALAALERAKPDTDVQLQIHRIQQLLRSVDQLLTDASQELHAQRRVLARRLWRCESRQLLPRFPQLTP
jgi:hypothetical protein